MLGLTAAGEGLDNDHPAAAAGAGTLWCLLFVGLAGGFIKLGIGGFDRLNWNYGRQRKQQLAGARHVFGALAAREHPVIADAVETRGQDMHQETTDELISCERHDSVTLGTFDPVVLPFEADASFVTCNEAP